MEQASLNIGTIGQKLEAARQAKGVSVSEAGQATKILSKFIEAMESDDFGALSAPVYAKSFIKMYAQYLGLDARPLVDEYVVQHAPKTKGQLVDDARQNLAKGDKLGGDSVVGTNSMNGARGNVFSGVHEAFSNVSIGMPLKYVYIAVGVVALLVIVLSVSQCSDDEAEAPAAGGAALMERQIISDDVPNAYLVKPGVVEVEK